MAFPEDPLGLLAEIQVDGVWEKLPLYTRSPVTHQRGVRNEGVVADPASVPMTINNKGGRYSPRNPMSPYFGKIGRNTRVRLSLPGEESYLQLDGSPTGYASTPDTAALDLTTNIDLRWEGEADWYARGAQMLIGKWGEAGQRSYHMRIEDGLLCFHGTTDGTVGGIPQTSLPAGLPRRAAVRVVLVNGTTCRWYWAESLDGPWNQFDELLLSNPFPSGVFVSTAPLLIAPSQLSTTVNRLPAAGRVYRAEVRGAGGTVVASPDFRGQAAGTSGFTDSAGRVWTLTGTAEIRDRVDRFIGEISEWPQKWQPSEADAWVPVQAAGILRRLGQGTKAVDSSLRRRIPSFGPMAYWPMEEGENATKAASSVAGIDPLSFSQANWAADASLPSSAPLPTVGSQSGNLSHLSGLVRNYSWANLAGWSVVWMYHMPQTPAARQTFMLIRSTGTVRDWYCQFGPTDSRILGLDREGATVVDQVIATGTNIFGKWIKARFAVDQQGSNIRYAMVWTDINGDAGFYQNTVAGVTGRPSGVASPPGGYSANLQGLAIGHISVWDTFDTAAYDNALDAWSGETAGARMLRLASQEGIPIALTGPPSQTDPVGYQKLSPVLDLVRAAAASDGGLLTEDQTALRLLYRPRSTLYSQTPALVLDYKLGQIAAPLEPVDDDTDIRNDVTVTRDQGSSTRVVLGSGPLSVLDPPDGVGVYDDSITLSLDTDEQTVDKAYWELHLGTWDEPRYPAVTINLHRHPELIPAVLKLREGDVIRLINMPKWVAPDDVDLMVRGLKEQLLPRTWTITYDCVPAGPWRVGVVGDEELGRLDADEGGSTLALPSTATDGQLLVHTPGADAAGALPWIASAGPAPTYPGEFPFDVRFGGERARVTACVPAAYDAFGRTVSGGWGVADCGFTWVGALGSASDRSVSGGIGIITLASVKDTARFQRIISQITDCEVLTRMSVSQVAAGAGIIPSILLRYTDPDNFYRARVRFNPGGTMTAEVTQAYTQVGASTALPYTYTAGAWFRVRARLTGHRVQVRVWPDGQQEPAAWHADQTITTGAIPAGDVGVTASTFGGNTNTNPAVRFDDFRVVTPQLMTVDRSVNGIVKTHAVGTPVSLANPTPLAL
ncbi:hypothetical protein [Streptomyces sp. NPDC048188]|uniref:hypothetical protein n=1 Tax=Streptomyces sp. NPDC048188 TaxID=3155749 RepID=UPI0034204E8E